MSILFGAASTIRNWMSESPWIAIGAILACVILPRLFITVLYRLLLSPIAKFPGPKLAAATGFYEFYFNFFKNGKYVFEIERLHNIYGMLAYTRERQMRRFLC
jgi:hypothetical protein